MEKSNRMRWAACDTDSTSTAASLASDNTITVEDMSIMLGGRSISSSNNCVLALANTTQMIMITAAIVPNWEDNNNRNEGESQELKVSEIEMQRRREK